MPVSAYAPVVLRQEILWIPEGRSVPRPDPVMTGADTRVWTLFTHLDPKVMPELPFVPVHHHNAFLEDYIHDWNHTNGNFRYYSRAMDSGVWVLIEHLKRPSRRKP
jgi:hypothetical protein